MDEFKKLNEQLGANVKALQEEHARLQIEGKQTSEKFEKIVADMAKLEAKNTELQAAISKKQGEEKDHLDKLVDLEKKLVEMSKPTGEVQKKNYKESAEYKALNMYAKCGIQAAMANVPEFKTVMRTDINSAGGYLVPELMASELIKQIENISPVRQFARVWTAQSKTLTIPVRTGIPAVTGEGELEAASDSKPTYRSLMMTAFRQAAKVGLTEDLMAFANFDVESLVMDDLRDAYAQFEGLKFLKGTGVKEPEGLLVNATTVAGAVDTTTSGATDAATLLDDVINLVGTMKQGYLVNARYFMNLKTAVFLRTAKSSSGGYLWTVGGESMPSTINQIPYVVLPDMPVISDGTGSKIVMVGDLRLAYAILDALQMSMIRDEITNAASGLTYLHFRRYSTGAVIIPEAVKLLKVKA